MRKLGAKKLGALVIALALVTVGGVYATWSFTNDGASQSTTDELNFSLATKTDGSTARGTLGMSIQDRTGTYIFSIDQYSYVTDATHASEFTGYSLIYNTTTTSDEVDAYKPVLVYDSGYSVKITYTPSATAAQTYQENGINASIQLSWNGCSLPVSGSGISGDPYYYDASSSSTASILSVDTTSTLNIYPVGTASVDYVWIWDGVEGYFYCEIPSSAFAAFFSAGDYIVIDTSAAWTALSSALSPITVTLTDTTTA